MTKAIEIAFACPQCGEPVESALEPGVLSLTCKGCEHETALPEAEQLLASAPLSPCPVCGSEDFYSQRDFNRKLGITVVVIGCALGPFTSWISVGVAVVIDFVLYLMVPSVAICYACNAQYRGFAPEQKPGDFDIAIHDVYKFDKRHPPRRDMAVAGPLRTRLRFEGKES
jgi:hypothetical protein